MGDEIKLIHSHGSSEEEAKRSMQKLFKYQRNEEMSNDSFTLCYKL